MIGYLLRKCKILDVIKVIELDECLKEVAYKLAYTQGIARGIEDVLDYVYDNVEISDTVDGELDKVIENSLEQKFKALIEDIQNKLGIGDKLFICDINKNIINVFDIGYDGFFNNEYKFQVSEDLAKVVIFNK